MSEYWVSKKKYYCKYCEIYITDDAPSRQQHENGLRHQGNRGRFIKDIYKTGERKKKDLEEEKREMKRVDAAAQAAYTLDLGSGRASTSTSTLTPPPAAPKKPPPKPSDPYQNYSTAESLGFVDTEAARLVAEAELKRSEGRMGDWSTVISIPKPPPPQPTPIASETTEPEAHPPIPEPEPSWRSLSNKKVGDGLRELYDPAGLIKVKIKPEQVEPPELAGVRSSSSGGGWTKTGWNTTDVVVDVKPVTEEDTRGAKEEERSDGVKVEESEGRAKLEEEPPADEPQPPPEGGLFKKRKAPSGTVGRGAKRKL